MASFDDLIREASGQSTTKKQDREKKKSFSELIQTANAERMNREVSRVDGKYIKSFVDTANHFLSSAETDYGKITPDNAEAYNRNRRAQYDSLKEQRQVLGTWLGTNKGSLDENTYRELSDVLSGFDEDSKYVMDMFSSAAAQPTTQAEMEQQSKIQDKYGWITQAADFGAKSANRNFGNPTMQEYDDYYLNLYGGQRLNPETNEIEYIKAPAVWKDPGAEPVIRDKLGFWQQIKNGDGTGYAGTVGTVGDAYYEIQQQAEDGAWDQLTNDEISTYYYLMNSTGADAAEQYLDDMRVELSRRRAQNKAVDRQKKYESANDWEKAGMNALSVPANVLGGAVAAIDGAVRKARGEEMNPYSNAYDLQDYATQVRGMTAQEIDQSGVKIPVLGFSLGDAYQSVMSSADSVLAAAVGGRLGGALLASNAGTSEAKRLYEMGATEEQIYAGSIAAGLTEMICETVSIGKLIDMKDVKTVGQFFKNALIQGGVEASEEAITELVNTLSNAVIMTDKSDWAQMVKEKGGNEGLALLEVLRNTTNAAIGGFISGAGSGGGVSAIKGIAGSVAQRADGQRINQSGATETLQQLALEMAEQDAGGLGKQLQRQAGKVSKNASAGNVGALYSTMLSADSAQLQERAKNQLIEQGFSDKKAGKIAEAMVLQASNSTMTREQTRLLDSLSDNEGVQKIYDNVAQYEGSVDQQLAQRTLAVNLKAALVQEGMSETEADALVTAVTQNAEQAQDIPADLQVGDQPAAQRYEQPQSAEGQVLYENQPVQLGKVKTAGNGSMIVELADGASVDAAQLSFPDQGQQELYQTVAKIADNAGTANMLLTGFQKGNASARIYARAVEQAFFYGRHQIPVAQLQAESPYAQALTAQQLEEAYALGLKARIDADTQRDKTASEGDPKRQRNGSVNYGYEGQSLDKSKLKATQRVGVDFMERIAKWYGVNSYFYRSYENENGERVYKNQKGQVVPADESGHYDPTDGSIHIDLNCGDMGDSVLFTIAHELTHFIQDWSPARYQKLCGILMEGFAQSNQSVKELILHKQEEYRKKGVVLTEEQAYDEVIASAMEGVLTDGRVMDLLDQVENMDKSLWEQIKSFCESVAELIRDTIAAYKNKKPDSPEGRIVQRMDHLQEQLQNVFAIGLSEGGHNYQRGGEYNADQREDLKWSRNGYDEETSRIKEQIENSMNRLNNIDVVADLSVPEDLKKKEEAATWAINLLKSTGYRVDRQGFGTIIFNENDIRYGAKYADTAEEKAAFAALPRVLKRGIEIARHNDHKQRAKQTITFAAPVLINGSRVNIAVVVNLRGNHYLVHRIVMPDGSVFRFSQTKDATRELHRGVPNEGSLADATSVASTKTVPQNEGAVNKKSVRYQMNAAAQRHLQAATGDMDADVDALKQLVSMLNKQTGMNRLKYGTLDAAASFLLKTAGARGDKQQLMQMLHSLYTYMGQNDGLSWDSVQKQARPIAEWLTDHIVRTKQMSEYAKGVLDEIRHSRIYLDDVQRKEVEYAFGSFGAYRRMMMGSVVLANDRSISLDSKWHEWAQMYPDVFDEDMNANDMPGELMNIVQRMRNSDTSELEFEYNREFMLQDMVNRVYDSYWNAATLYVVADQYEQKIRQLKSKHKQRMAEVYHKHQAAENALRQDFKRRTEKLLAHYEERYQRRESEYRDSRRNAVERHDKAQIRQQIRKDVERLANLLNKGNKQKNVKQELQAFAGAALRTAQGTFLNNYNEYDMIRNGLNTTMSREQKQIFQRCRELLAELDKVRDEKSAEPGADNLHDKWDPEAALRREDREDALKKELAKNMRVLREAGLFRTENELMEDSNAEQLMNELLTAYSALKDSELAHVRGVYSQVIYDQIDSVKKFLAGKAVKDMTTVELKELQKMYRMVMHTVSTSNELFSQKRKADVQKLGEEVITQLQDPGKAMTPEMLDHLKKMGWSMLKPETALELIGSDTLTEMMQGLYRGEDTYALDIDHARKFAQEQADKYGRKDWKLDEAVPFAGTKITLGQAMSLYAYTKRQQAQGHLEGDGFTQASNVRIKETLGKLPIKLKYIMNATKTHIVSKQMYEKVADLLTPQQRKYADAMVEYLSKTMGAKGNEVSMALYGIELFNEKAYFPLKTASEYHEEALGATAGEVKLKNNGFTKKVQEGASNPIVLDDFESVWAAHVDKMSLYHGFVLPMEDFDRVYNYHRTAERDVTDAAGEVYKTELVDTNETVKVDIENKAGKAANDYIEQFMQQLNGNNRRGNRVEEFFRPYVSNFKRAAVLGSLSVAIQQPTAFVRAMAHLDLQDIADWKNWLGKTGKPEGRLVEEMYKYAPVALMKHIGGFDPSLGRSSQEYIFGNRRGLIGAMENVLGILPEKMDEWTWTYIWVCTKRQIHRQNPDLRVGSKEFCEKAGERFSQIIRDTQVYDSVLVKSQIMREKSVFLQMATAFMNEPTTSMDMYIRSTIQAMKGKISKAQTARTYAAVVGSQLICAAVAAFVYAARDDDEDETFWEKYLSAAISKAKEGILPWYNIPFVKDIFSVFKGYDVERSDMSLITDLYQGLKKWKSDKATAWEKYEALAGSILNLFGIPLKNVSRDVRGIYNTIDHWINPRTTATKAGTRYAALEGLSGKKVPKVEQLQNAAVENDAAHILRVMATYEKQSSAESAFHEGVQKAYMNGDLSAEKVIEQLQTYTNDDEQEAKEYIQYWDFKKQHPDSELSKNAAVDWCDIASSGISLEVYTQYCENRKGLTKKEDVMRVIHNLDLSKRQKDALYLSAGYAESTIDEAPWR